MLEVRPDDQPMITTDDKETERYLKTIPDLTERTELMWYQDWYDGPLSGYALVDGQPGYWFEMVKLLWRKTHRETCCKKTPNNLCKYDYENLYLVYQLMPEQDRVIQKDHELFKKYVGDTSTLSDKDNLSIYPKSQRNPDRYYKAEKKAITLSSDLVVGYISW